MTVHISKVISAGDKIMPLSIGSCFSCHIGRRPEISDPIIDKPSTKNCELISTTCNVDGITVISRSSYGFDMKPPGAGERAPRLKLSASEAQWMAAIIDAEGHNISNT